MAIENKSLLDDLPPERSALTQAIKLGGLTATVGFEWPDWIGARMKVGEELAELDAALAANAAKKELEHELGDLLLAVASLARYLKIDPEQALLQTNAKFARRFRYVEARLQAQGRTPNQSTLEEMQVLWEAAKAEEK